MVNLTHVENIIRKKMIMDNEYNKKLKTLEQLIKEYNKADVYENIDEKYEKAFVDFMNKYKVIVNDSSNEFESIASQTTLNYSLLDASSNAVKTSNAVETSNAIETSNAVNYTNIITNIMNITCFKINVVLFALAYLYN